MDGRISLSFSNYMAASTSWPPHYNQKDEEIQSDEEEVRSFHTLVVLIEKQLGVFSYQDDDQEEKEASTSEEFPYILVHQLSETTTMLRRKTSGATGFDLAADRTCVIEPRGRALVSLGAGELTDA